MPGGGSVANPTYEQVSSGDTGHAETIQIEFDPNQINYELLLEVFWRVHDPTTLNRQGADVGTQYRSVIFYHNDQQKTAAEKSKVKIENEGVYSDPIVTQIVPYTEFYSAEDYHQDYFENNQTQPYCQVVISPKLGKFREKFAELLKKD